MNRLKFFDNFRYLLLIGIFLLFGITFSCRSLSSTKQEQPQPQRNTEAAQSNKENLPFQESAIANNWKENSTSDRASGSNDILPISWSFSPGQYRGKNGQQYTFKCPLNGEPSSVYGTDVYTDDSSVCTAAAHEGLISTASGGIVTIEIRAGQDAYVGSERNNIKSSDFNNHWLGSFVFVRNRMGGS